MLPQLEALLRASTKVAAFHVVDNDPIDETNFLFKVRCELTSGHVLQIRLHAVAGHLRYSYQEFTEGPLRRWDNAPHFSSWYVIPRSVLCDEESQPSTTVAGRWCLSSRGRNMPS